MAKRAHVNLKTKLAAALRELARIPVDHAQLMTADQLISLFQWDHNLYHVHDGGDEHYNLTPMMIASHREKTAKIDVPQIAKTRRISREQEAFRQRLLTPREDRPVRKSRIQSRGFEKKRKP